MENLEIKQNIKNALNILYRTESDLFKRQMHEQTISARLMIHLQHLLPEWHVDVEFNREEENQPKTDSDGKKRRPDIIIHKRGKQGPNLTVILVKCDWNNEPREDDAVRAKSIKDKHNYQSAFLLEIKKNSYQLEEL